MVRSDDLQGFLDAAFAAYERFAKDPEGRRSVAQIAEHLKAPRPERPDIAKRLAVCDDHLDTVLAARGGEPLLDRLAERFRTIEPLLEWKARPDGGGTASESFPTGHANAMIVGPGGLEDRRDVWLGVSLLAPGVRYPDHDHAPEETYLVLSDGEFQHGDSGWFSPGVGGSFYNSPGIRHAMRAGDKPLFAFWALLPDRPQI